MPSIIQVLTEISDYIIKNKVLHPQNCWEIQPGKHFLWENLFRKFFDIPKVWLNLRNAYVMEIEWVFLGAHVDAIFFLFFYFFCWKYAFVVIGVV